MRFAARHRASAPHDSMLLYQKLRPASSGSRLRKSMYCCRTKYSDVSSGFSVLPVEIALKAASVFCPSWLKERCIGLKMKFARDGVTV